MDFKLEILNRVLLFKLELIKKSTIPVNGVSSRCADSRHVLFLDYDNIDVPVLNDELCYVQKKYYLFPFMVFQSSKNNYHAVSLSKRSFAEIVKIQQDTSCDYAFSTIAKYSKYRSWVLRISNEGKKKKPKFIGWFFDTPYYRGELSTAHKIFFSVAYNIKMPSHLPGEDGFKKTVITMYQTPRGRK